MYPATQKLETMIKRQQIRQYLQNQRLNAERDAAVQGRRKGACHYHQV